MGMGESNIRCKKPAASMPAVTPTRKTWRLSPLAPHHCAPVGDSKLHHTLITRYDSAAAIIPLAAAAGGAMPGPALRDHCELRLLKNRPVNDAMTPFLRNYKGREVYAVLCPGNGSHGPEFWTADLSRLLFHVQSMPRQMFIRDCQRSGLLGPAVVRRVAGGIALGAGGCWAASSAALQAKCRTAAGIVFKLGLVQIAGGGSTMSIAYQRLKWTVCLITVVDQKQALINILIMHVRIVSDSLWRQAYTHTRTHTRLHAYTHAYTRTRMHADTHTCLHAYTSTRTHICD